MSSISKTSAFLYTFEKSMDLFSWILAMKSFVNFSEDAKTTFSCFFPLINVLAIECSRWLLPKPTPPYIISGLKSLEPGFLETFRAAFFAKTLFGPSMKDSKVFPTLILCLLPVLLCLTGSLFAKLVATTFCCD